MVILANVYNCQSMIWQMIKEFLNEYFKSILTRTFFFPESWLLSNRSYITPKFNLNFSLRYTLLSIFKDHILVVNYIEVSNSFF